MSKRQFKSQASSGRAGFGSGGFGNAGFGSTQSSVLSYVQEPPDYSSITDANTVVCFKNLSKKDSTTKAKALDDLQRSLASSQDDVEDAVVEAWVALFPRLSIDNAHRVRQLAHSFNGRLCAKIGRRIAKHLPRIAGPWIAGIYDADRSTAKAAQEALSTMFPTPEKIQNLRKTFLEPILTYCKDAALHESVQTLSDLRIISPEDAAMTYARVVASCLTVISSLLSTLSPEDISTQRLQFESVLNDSKTWTFVYYSDTSIRRSMHRLVQTCLSRDPLLIDNNIQDASNAYIYKGLPSDQTGSAADFAYTLDSLTASFTSIWTTAYKGKKPAISRFQQCLRHGSHAGPPSFWEAIKKVIVKIPHEIYPQTFDQAVDLLSAAKDGVTRKEERLNASAAWMAYFTLVDVLTALLPVDLSETILNEFAMPPVNQYLHPLEENNTWTIAGTRQAPIVANVVLVKRIPPLLQLKWPHLVERLIEIAKMSQPEQSRDFERSQTQITIAGERWSALQREFLNSKYNLSETLLHTFVESNTKLLKENIGLLKTRNGKPYGAAAVIEHQLKSCGDHLIKDLEFRQTLTDFVTHDVPSLMLSPSQRYLTTCVYVIATSPEFDQAFQRILDAVLHAEQSSDATMTAIHNLFPYDSPRAAVTAAQEYAPLQTFLASQTVTKDYSDLLKLGIVSEKTSNNILGQLVGDISAPGSDVHQILYAFELLSIENGSAIRHFVSDDARSGAQLMPSILKLESSPDEHIAEKAIFLSSKFASMGGDTALDSRFSIIIQSLEKVDSSSLAIDTVLDLADRILGEKPEPGNSHQLLPDAALWRSSILSITKSPKVSLSLLNPLAGATFLIQPDTKTAAGELPRYDAEGLSQALRIAMYIVRLIDKPEFASQLGPEKPTIIALLSLCSLLADDSTSILGTNGLWRQMKHHNLEIQVLDFVSDANRVVRHFWETDSAGTTDAGGEESPKVFRALEKVQAQASQDSAVAYYSSLAFAKGHEAVFELHGYSREEANKSEENLKQALLSKDPLVLLTCLVAFAEPLAGSQILSRLCNELVAELTSLDPGKESRVALERTVVLNAILASQEDIVSTIAKSRLIFLVKHVILWLRGESQELVAEACKTLTRLLPGMHDMYGEHWGQILDSLLTLWNAPRRDQDIELDITVLHATLKLYTSLQRLSKNEDTNEDLIEALRGFEPKTYEAFVGLLKTGGEISDEDHQPLMVTNELLARLVSQLPLKPFTDAEDLYSLLYAPSRSIQGAAFDLLHRHIPAAQEQISIDAALDDKTSQLPDELLSLVIGAPTLDSLADASFDRLMPISLQGYLYSWRLLFDHFNGASFRVKTDYIEQLKAGAYLQGLLSLTFDFLGHTRGRPVDISRVDVQEYIPDTEPSPEKDTQWLLAHLYYLALINLPSLVKTYYLDIRSRGTSQAVESWTSKYISPLIIAENLKEVAEWAEKSVKEDPDYEAMTVKVGMKSKEINVSYAVDEHTMAIKVVLPDAYPLVSAQVISVNRVAAKEEKWQSWLRNCQGVITFSNGSITDGLAAWRKNVTGALKGQTECAICYSIISAAKELPTKRCPTCKNLFHSSCLFRWFNTSNSSGCPLCRNAFSFH